MMKLARVLAAIAAVVGAGPMLAQQPSDKMPGKQLDNIVLSQSAAQRISPHVFAIFGNPNIAIVVGTKATLVIDTGLGPPNGRFIASEVARLRKSEKLFLATTHAHPEHSAGQAGFPADTVVIRPKVQQQELEEIGPSGIDAFASRSAVNRDLLAGAHVGGADILFDDELTLDLGDVTAQLSWFGPAHSNGDMLTFIAPDGVLVSGDVVQNKAGPSLSGSRSTLKSWIAVLDKVAQLRPKLILPDHSLPGDASLIPEQRAFLVDLLGKIEALKGQRKSAEEAAQLINVDFKARYPGWTRLQFLERSVIAEYAQPAH